MTTEALTTRALAARTLDRVLNEGAYSNVLIANIDAGTNVDRSLYQRLVFDALRFLPAIDEAIEAASSRRIDRIQREVLAVLRIATTEVRYLRRPTHSAVSSAVEAVRELGRGKASGFVNAVMRSVVRQIDEPVPAEAYLAMPAWLYARLVAIFGDDADDFVTASNSAALTGVRSRDGRQRGEAIGIPGAGYLPHDDTLVGLADAGTIDIIDPASVAVVNALEVETGDRILDVAAAPGGKTRIIADKVGPHGLVTACDVHTRRLAHARERSHSMEHIRWIVSDASKPPFRDGVFDKVLLDAPCTGLGTLRRRPEIRHRVDEAAPARYGHLQRSMLEATLALVRPGGRLVYSVCTVFPEETTEVVGGLGALRPPEAPGIPWGDGSLLAPHVTGTDGMFIAVFDR
ncbi:MAG: 16S rRNA (cytosine(967)-C(5))-methyltransferase RsmB [Acidimicrobiia bacterium]|nr:MAG: 16S rRNA (cytosine(967)-C(5))-methyltransferase RsmB [Acidimicrobiia bacterium]